MSCWCSWIKPPEGVWLNFSLNIYFESLGSDLTILGPGTGCDIYIHVRLAGEVKLFYLDFHGLDFREFASCCSEDEAEDEAEIPRP